MATWDGVANDEESPLAKALLRNDVDLPEWIDKKIRTGLPPSFQVSELWRGGLVDIRADDDVIEIRMTLTQARFWEILKEMHHG